MQKKRLRELCGGQGDRFPVLHRIRFRLPLASGLRRHWATTCCVCLCRHFEQSCMALEALRGLSEHDSSLPAVSQDVSSQRCMGWGCFGHGAPPATENAPAFRAEVRIYSQLEAWPTCKEQALFDLHVRGTCVLRVWGGSMDDKQLQLLSWRNLAIETFHPCCFAMRVSHMRV